MLAAVGDLLADERVDLAEQIGVGDLVAVRRTASMNSSSPSGNSPDSAATMWHMITSPSVAKSRSSWSMTVFEVDAADGEGAVRIAGLAVGGGGAHRVSSQRW